MRVVVAWVILGTLLAFTVLGAVSAQKIPEVVSWVVAGVVLAAGLGAMIVSAEPLPPRQARASRGRASIVLTGGHERRTSPPSEAAWIRARPTRPLPLANG